MTAMQLTSATRADILRRGRKRNDIERLLNLAAEFAEPDRLLVQQIFQHGMPIRQAARLLNVAESTLHRRLRTLLQRTRDPLFTFVACHQHNLPKHLRPTAKRIVLQGQSLREAADNTQQSLHTIRQHMQAIRALAQAQLHHSPLTTHK